MEKDQKQKQMETDTNLDQNMEGIDDLGDEWDVPSGEQHESLVRKVEHMEIQLQTFFNALDDIKNQISKLSELMHQERRVMTAQPYVPPDPNMPSTSKDSGTMFKETATSLSGVQSRSSPVLKDMKPPQFNGEEQDRNKDTIYTFLQKWKDFHKLKNTPHLNINHLKLVCHWGQKPTNGG